MSAHVLERPVVTPPRTAPSSTSAAGGRHPLPTPSSRIGGLDGLRAIAVAAVVTYHLGAEWIPGGFLGVDLFFVISGFLITTLLLTEVSLRGRIDFGGFYLRRARRLLPALVLMLLGTALIVSTVARDSAEQFLRDVPGAALYISNWWAIGQEQSYFELIGRGNMLGHLWSLAVEEQFYLVWPVLLGLLCWIATQLGVQRRRVVLVAALGGALVSTMWMASLAASNGYPIDADPTRVYFGTDTHAMSVLIGAALATVWRPGFYRSSIPSGARTILVGVGGLALAASLWLFVTVDEYTPWLYRGGFLLAAVVFGLLIAAASHPGSPLGRMLDLAPLRWVGERSYGIYLWHWPIFLVTRPGIDVPWEGPLLDVARVALVLAVAELSYRFVETPIRHGALGRAWHSLRSRSQADGLAVALLPGRRRTLVALATGAVVSGLLVASLTGPHPAPELVAYGVYGSTDAIDDDTTPAVTPAAGGTGGSGASVTKPDRTKPSASTSASASASASASPSAPASATTTGGKRSVAGLGTADVAWYGDSVTLWSADVLRRVLPGVRLNAAINRSPGNIQDAALASLERGTLPRIVVMHMGTAGPVSQDRLEATVARLGDRARIVLVTSTARFAWVKSSNAVMADVARGHENVVLADWKRYTSGHADWLTDGLHLTEKGKPYFAKFIKSKALTDK